MSMAPDEKHCPFCGEHIKAVAIQCKYCKSILDEPKEVLHARKNDDEMTKDKIEIKETDFDAKMTRIVTFASVAILIFAVILTSPSKQDFADFISDKAFSTDAVKNLAEIGGFGKDIMSVSVQKTASQDNFLFFSIFEVDNTIIKLFDPSVPRFRFLGICGLIIPLFKYDPNKGNWEK